MLNDLSWPEADGGNGYILQTDGAGNLSWTEQSSGGGGSSYITTDDEQAVTYYPLGGASPSYSEPTESLKLEGNLRLDKNNSGTSGSLVVEDQLVIKLNSTVSNSAFNDMYKYSAFNHPLGPIVDALQSSDPDGQWGATNMIFGDTNRIVSNKGTAIESAKSIHLSIKDGPMEDAKAFISTHMSNNLPGTSFMQFRSNGEIHMQVGKDDGSDSLPTDVYNNTQPFTYTVTAGGYDQTTYIQQEGVMRFLAGSNILLASPEINIGSLGYGPFSNAVNSTTKVTISAVESIDLSANDLHFDCNVAYFLNDINISKQLIIDGHGAGGPGQVLTSGGSGNSMSWTTITSSVFEDQTPKLGADLDVNGKKIVSSNNANILFDPDGTGIVEVRGNQFRGSGEIQLKCENNQYGVKIKGPPESPDANYTLTLPQNVGASGQVLQTTGSGVLVWASGSSGGSSGGTSIALTMTKKVVVVNEIINDPSNKTTASKDKKETFWNKLRFIKNKNKI